MFVKCLVVTVELPTLHIKLLADNHIPRIVLLAATDHGFCQYVNRRRGRLYVIVELLHLHGPGDFGFHHIPCHWTQNGHH